MYPGYDNYWMCDSLRQEPGLYFQKNDSFRLSACTDSYKQVQGKGSSNNAYNYAPNPNNVTASHHNIPNDQHRATSTQSMLPSPACLQPYPSSLISQYLPNEVCSALPTNVPDSCVPLQNQVLRNVPNYSPGQTVNYKSSAGPANNQESCNYKTHTNSIRVKDFSMLNNNSKNSNCNSLLVNGSHHFQQKRPWYYLHDSHENIQNRTSKVWRDSNNCSSNAMVEVNYSYQNYGSTASHNYHVSNEEKNSQHPAALYQHNAQYEGQVCYDSLLQGTVKSNDTNYSAVQSKNPIRIVTQEADEQRRLDSGRHCDNNTNNCSALNMSESSEVNPNSTAQLVRPERIQNALQSPSVSTSRTDPTAKSPSHNSNNEVTSFGMTVPGTAQSTTSLGDSTETNKNSDLASTSSNLVNITLIDCAVDRVSNQKNGLVSSEGGAGPAVSQLDQQGPGCVRNENQNLRKETVIVCDTERALGCIVTPKVENLRLGKDSLEDEKAGCPDEAEVGAIKKEVDRSVENENTDKIEQLSDLKNSKLPETENSENTDSLLSDHPLDKPETVSTALNESQQSDVVILDEAETFAEPTEVGDEIDSLAEDKCKNEINRDKLDLLIKFLKRDGEPLEVLTIAEDESPPPETSPQKEKPPKKNRRKLSKASIVRNKNTEREMISLMSYKTPKSVKNSLTEETKTTSAKSSDGSKDSDFGATLSEDKQPEGSRDEEQQGSSTPEEEDDRSPTESAFNCSCNGKGITREERNIINIMRAFRNLKRHFCASCAFTSPVESIWVNIVSGELRCVNCFKKTISKAEENHESNSKKCSADGSSKLKAAVARKDDEGKNSEKKSKCEGRTPAEEAYRRREDLKDRVEETHGMCFENSGDLKKDGSGRADQKNRATRSDEVEEPKRTKSAEKAFFYALRLCEKHRKKGGEEAADSSDGSVKRSNSAEEFVPRKKTVSEEDGDMRWDTRVLRSRSRDSCSSQKSTISEKAVEKSKKHESGRSKTPNCTGGCSEQKSLKTKEGKAEHELKRKGHDIPEKAKRKSMTPEEEIDLNRASIKNFLEKSKVDVERNKVVEKSITDEKTEKVRTNGEVKEQSRSPKNPEEDPNKSEKVFSPTKKKRKRGRAELRDTSCVPPWEALEEESKPRKMFKRSEEVECHLPKIRKKKRQYSVSKNEEITKHSRQKTAKISERKPAGKHSKSSKQCLISRLFKGKRCLKLNPGNKYLNKEFHRKEERGEERRREKEAKEKRRHSQPRSMSFHRTVDNSSRKRKHSRKEPAEGKEPQHRTWKNGEETPTRSPKQDRRDTEGTVNDTAPKSSCSESPLFIRLMKTTTKLSLRLLGES